MARPKKCRRVAFEPEFCSFFPDGTPSSEPVFLSIDEFEVIRLLDLEGKNQLECAEIMGVARTTITQVYEDARKKIADSIVHGKTLFIRGGDYEIEAAPENKTFIKKGENIMRIAVTYENENVFQHFGHTQKFKFYDVENNSIVKEEIVDTMGQGHGALATFLKDNKADLLICGGIGGGAQMALGEVGIKIYGGVSGLCDEAVKALIAGTLEYNPNVKCNHHGEHGHGHGEGHSCGGHGHGHGEGHSCASHSCEKHDNNDSSLPKFIPL